MSGPNVNISSNPDYVAGGEFGAVIQSTNTAGVPAAIVDGDLTVNGTVTGTISGTATAASTVTIVDNTTLNATVYPTWVTAATGNLPETVSSTKLTFHPSTGVLTATGFAGPLVGNVTGNVTGNASGTAATVTGAAQAAITSVGRLNAPSAAPATATDTGVTGTITWDAGFLYVCIATNTWVRVAVATWP